MKNWKHVIFGLSIVAFSLFGIGQLEANPSSTTLIAKGGHGGHGGHHGGGHHGGHHGHHGGHHGHHGGHHGHHHGHHHGWGNGWGGGWGDGYYWGGAGLGGAYYPYYYSDPGYYNYDTVPSTYYYQTTPQYVVPATESTIIQQVPANSTQQIPITPNTEYSQ